MSELRKPSTLWLIPQFTEERYHGLTGEPDAVPKPPEIFAAQLANANKTKQLQEAAPVSVLP